MMETLKSVKKTLTAYFWKRYDMFWMGIDSKTEEALLMAEMENDEEKYISIWFRKLLEDAWWHT